MGHGRLQQKQKCAGCILWLDWTSSHRQAMGRCYHARMKSLKVCLLLFSVACFAMAQNGENGRLPVIDVHVHAFDSLPNVGPICPFPAQFTASDAKLGNEHQLGWADQECSPALEPAKNQDEYMKELIAEWDRLN